MNKEQHVDHHLARRREGGQVMVLFIIGIFAIIGMVGIVLDGGSVFAQRRDQQTAADLAAMAGATAYLNATGTVGMRVASAKAMAASVAQANGYDDGSGGVDIDVTVTSTSFYHEVKVDLHKPHRNNFASILGMGTWPVSVTATARSTFQANGARGAMPLMFNQKAFPGAICNEAAGTCTPQVYQLPGTGNEDVPQDATQFNWTVFCTAQGNVGSASGSCNVNSNEASKLINGIGANTVVYLDDNIAALNAGSHTTLFKDTELGQHVGKTFPVPVVDDDGNAVGWAYFYLASIEGAPDKVITGYFVSPVNGEELVVNGGHTNGTLFTGAYSVRLTN